LVVESSNQIVLCERVWMNTIEDIIAAQITASQSLDEMSFLQH
jgi:hypothetical protein